MPVWRPPPPMPSERPVPLPPIPQPTQAEPIEAEDEPMSHTWGHTFRQAAGGIGNILFGERITPDYSSMFAPSGSPLGPLPEPAAVPAATVPVTGMPEGSCDGMIWSGGVPPKGYKVVNSCGVGVLRKVRRRRRRRLLTASDKADISYIVATTGKGQLAASLIHRSAQ